MYHANYRIDSEDNQYNNIKCSEIKRNGCIAESGNI